MPDTFRIGSIPSASMDCSPALSPMRPPKEEPMLQKTEITVAGRRVSLLRAGNAGGEPIVLLHGGRAGLSPIACGARLFDRVIPLLASGRTVIAPDLPGCGGTELKSPQDLNVEKLAEFVVALLDALSIKRAHVVGHDLGGFIGLWLAV